MTVHRFVTSNLTDETNRVSFYDEHWSGKGADALICSLRIKNILIVLDSYRVEKVDVPSSLVNLLENCVGQNKSNVVMKFFAMVSLLLFKKVVLLYLIPGHNHMAAYRIVAWC